MAEARAPTGWQRLMQWGSEAAATITLLVVAVATNAATPPVPLTFTERDPTYSYQLTEPETVPFTMLLGISLGIPAAVVAVVHTVKLVAARGTPRAATGVWDAVKSFGWIYLCFGQCMCVVFALTNAIKIAVGRQRPNFFALCNYQGYGDALKAGGSAADLGAYWNATTPGAFGSLANCWGSQGNVWEGQKSFPSGHSSMSFGAMLFTALYLRAAFGIAANVHVTVPAIIAASPLIISSWVAISRVRDRWHNPDDIAVGSLIGIGSALVAWWHYRAHRRSGYAPTTGPAALDDDAAAQSSYKAAPLLPGGA